MLVGIGAINPVDGDVTGSITFWGAIMTLISCAALAFCTEKLKEKNKGKTNKVKNGNIIDGSVSEEQTIGNEGAVVLTGMLNTELAVKVFAKAIEAGYMNEKGSHYEWNDSKVLLAYMCGRDMRKYRTVSFVNGCFWHRHQGCKYFVLPKTNLEFWSEKIERNRNRNVEEHRQLDLWHCITVWECQLKPKVRQQTLESLAYTLSHIFWKIEG